MSKANSGESTGFGNGRFRRLHPNEVAPRWGYLAGRGPAGGTHPRAARDPSLRGKEGTWGMEVGVRGRVRD
ncbi:MAG: hypothetical protein H6581_07950 [Bacteroidia bacterium]|nr:hypothetical protein [Bacteroidia bacterium]